VLRAGFIVTAVVGFAKGMGTGSPFDFIVQNIFVPLNATVFSLLAFFIASAAFRAFKARSFEATLLLLAAILVMLGRVPIGDYLIERSAYLFKTMNFDSGFNFVMKIKASKIAEWIVSVPSSAGQRAIILGAALGAISTSLKLILGIEKSYLGKEE
jgi:hypothetical protein